jgi:hypothetical protein
MRKDPIDMNLTELTELKEVVGSYIALGVGAARGRGETWEAIGKQLGCSMQEAHRRYRYMDRKPMKPPRPDSL